MKCSYQTATKMLDAGMVIAEFDNCGHKHMAIGGRVLTDKAREMFWQNDYLVDVINTELDNVRCRLGLVHVWVRGH